MQDSVQKFLDACGDAIHTSRILVNRRLGIDTPLDPGTDASKDTDSLDEDRPRSSTSMTDLRKSMTRSLRKRGETSALSPTSSPPDSEAKMLELFQLVRFSLSSSPFFSFFSFFSIYLFIYSITSFTF